MAAIPLRDETLKELQDKVVVISGSAHGIGAATVSLLYSYGSKIIHGDWDVSAGAAVDSSLSPSKTPSPNGGESTFVQTDVTDYDSILNLFDTAWKKYGRVDIAISNAGVQEAGNWFDPALTISSVKEKPPTKVLDVNLLGTLYFSRVAAVYLKQDQSTGTSTSASLAQDKSLLLISSTAGFKETPGLFTYTASKHGVLGLLRSLRPYLPKTHGIRVNALCPWMTDTVMVQGIREGWVKEGLPVNSPGDVARVMVEVAVGKVPTGEKRMRTEGEKWNGRAVFVEGGRGWDIEMGIEGTEDVWLGESVSRTLNRGQEVLGDGTDWVKT